MAFPENAVSLAARELRSLIASGVDDLGEGDILIGHPKWAQDKASTDRPNLSLFFYHVEVDGYPADSTLDQPFYIRLYCLITPLSVDTSSSAVLLGENDLRLVGEVLDVLHRNSLLSVSSGSDVVERLQIVPVNIPLENLNHIWSTQGDMPYRLSLAYQLSLAPVPLKVLSDLPSPLVGATGVDALSGIERSPMPETGPGVATRAPAVPLMRVDTSRDDWSPALSFVSGNTFELSFSLQVERTDLPVTLQVQVAAPNGATVRLVWEVWERRDDGSLTEWANAVADSLHGSVTLPADGDDTSTINPKQADSRRIYSVSTPVTNLPADSSKRQAVLYAVHDWIGPGMTESLPLRSNPLLIFVVD